MIGFRSFMPEKKNGKRSLINFHYLHYHMALLHCSIWVEMCVGVIYARNRILVVRLTYCRAGCLFEVEMFFLCNIVNLECFIFG